MSEARVVGQRLRLRYRKDEVLMYIGHIDLLRFMMKLLRKTQFPFATSGMFSPKPRVTFGPALPLGVMADNELLDIELAEGLQWNSEEIDAALRGFVEAAAPRDFAQSLIELAQDSPPIARQAQRARYLLSDGELSGAELLALLAEANLEIEAKGKLKDYRAGIAASRGSEAGLVLEGGVSGETNLNIVQIAKGLEALLGRPLAMRRLCLLDSSGTEL